MDYQFITKDEAENEIQSTPHSKRKYRKYSKLSRFSNDTERFLIRLSRILGTPTKGTSSKKAKSLSHTHGADLLLEQVQPLRP